ncbi:ATP phosphoribosyltransferase regulatory subunit [Thalassocella blandensis]|nr:ATP phosphoribosyltransferase regulatory subunit [Thalassocella blandensis]
MSKVDRWLLPDGIEEVLPNEANQIEQLRQRLLHLFETWGYDYVIPPMVEFTDSLLTGSGRDIELLTFKLTDQLSGKTMGIRADITPQAARMDAHSLQREGTNRLCYAGHVMHTRPKTPLSSRTPLMTGVELFGESGLDADIEIVSLLLAALSAIRLEKQYIDIGHVGVFRSLAEFAELNSEQELALFGLLQTKSQSEINAWLDVNVADEQARQWFSQLPKFSGSTGVLDKAREAFAEAPAEVLAALDELQALINVVSERYPNAQFYCDLSELRGYHYHTGIVFGAFAPGVGNAIASGGRYDHIGEAFGRSRPATGFDLNLTAICRLLRGNDKTEDKGIFAPETNSYAGWQKVLELREQGERVVCGLSGQTSPRDHQNCDRILREQDGQLIVEKL